MWTCPQCTYDNIDDTAAFCGRCGQARAGEGGYAVYLLGIDPARKIAVIKAVRELLGSGLKETKDLVEAAPQLIAGNLTPEAAHQYAQALQAAGAVTEVTPPGAQPSMAINPRPPQTTTSYTGSRSCSFILFALAVGVVVLLFLLR
jgi:ribosomal protein L7/L12